MAIGQANGLDRCARTGGAGKYLSFLVKHAFVIALVLPVDALP